MTDEVRLQVASLSDNCVESANKYLMASEAASAPKRAGVVVITGMGALPKSTWSTVVTSLSSIGNKSP